MSRKAIEFIKNYFYTLTSNLVSLLISTLVILVLPKLIGVEEYGYYQLYLFYSSYVGFMHFGWNDGIYLRYGGKEYKNLDKGLFFSQFYSFVFIQTGIAVIIIGTAILFLDSEEKTFIIQMTAICLFLVNTKNMLGFILQSTNRIKEYSQIILYDRILYCCLIIVFLIFGIRNVELLIISDLIGKLLSLSVAVYYCKDIVFRKISSFYFSFRESLINIRVGIKLMLSNIASMLIIGTVRFGIERSWGVAVFGKVSLTLSISSLLMVFINALGIIMFPILRRTKEGNLEGIYIIMRNFLMVLLLGSLIIYYPLKIILVAWLPEYNDSLIYMILLFPLCVYEGKMALLINTYYKTLRKEKMLLGINVISLIISITTTVFIALVLKDLNVAVFSIFILIAIRCIIAEIILSKSLKIFLYKDILYELLVTLIFILAGWYFSFWYSLSIYLFFYIWYLVIKKNDILNTIKNIRELLK
ncbi:hypothetical protein CSV74_07575 [Sporosarcina sp. P19]|uniref:hypothetical protein n=1 Tax=Sporosarcina sp. P19 TaxID=2048258 RepID=UPI000C170A13|nr:hypothetical protein [Sporosarcina sp. P19]PIC77123.1 hypothetical protein CSV74_07575 [Sporosarcina sp. P19]